jgi:hypothetical protein
MSVSIQEDGPTDTYGRRSFHPRHELQSISLVDRVLRQCKVPRAEVMFITIQRGNIRPTKKEMNEAVTMLIMPDVWS